MDAGGWLGALRSDARERFESMAWPTPEDEDWRRTELGRLDLSSYLEDSARSVGEACRWEGEPGASAGYIRFDAGACVEAALAARHSDQGVRLAPLGDGGNHSDSLVAGLLREAYAGALDRVAVWHFARLEYGAILHVPAGMRIEEPFFIDFEERGEGRFAAPQAIVILGEGSAATVFVRISESSGSRVLCNARVDLSLARGSSLRLFESQNLGPESLHFQSSTARLAEGASLERLEVQLGASVVKTRVNCSLEGRGAEARLDGAYYRGSGQAADVGTELRHRAPGAKSRAYYKGAVAGGGRSVFQGLIEVAEGASGTDAFLSNRNLLLGEGARADSIPTLKIGNNDVRCSHGSATGRLGEEELFYLRSRGLSEVEAQRMLVLGFFEDVLALSPEAFREDALAGLAGRLPAAV